VSVVDDAAGDMWLALAAGGPGRGPAVRRGGAGPVRAVDPLPGKDAGGPPHCCVLDTFSLRHSGLSFILHLLVCMVTSPIFI